MGKTVTIRMDNETYGTFVQQAEEAHRSLGKFIEIAALRYTMHSAFADEEEMQGLFQDRGLIRRIRRGTADAKAGRGRLVG